jgi:hypothetical protein
MSSGLFLGAFTKVFAFGDCPSAVAERLYSLRSDLRRKSRKNWRSGYEVSDVTPET